MVKVVNFKDTWTNLFRDLNIVNFPSLSRQRTNSKAISFVFVLDWHAYHKVGMDQNFFDLKRATWT